MKSGMKGSVVLFAALVLCTGRMSGAETGPPVRIGFDPDSERVDLVTGKKLPEYIRAQRGSVRFFLSRLDTPDEFFNFFHDGIRKAEIKSLKSIEKVQGRFAVWRLNYLNGGKNTPRIHHLAVSFIPLSSSTNEPELRVHLLLNDLRLIDWGGEEE